MKSILIDAGPIIALFDAGDRYHHQAVGFVRENTARMVTTWPVITEVSHMLDFSVSAQLDFLEWCRRGALRIENIDHTDLDRIIELTRKYSDVPMDLADSSLILIAEKLEIREIATIDSDYYIYRTMKKDMLVNIFPSS